VRTVRATRAGSSSCPSCVVITISLPSWAPIVTLPLNSDTSSVAGRFGSLSGTTMRGSD
jgi:hypothetical protein